MRAKTIQASGETLEEQLVRMDKSLKRHDRDLIKLKPVTLQAPPPSNTEADILSCLVDLMAERLGRTFKQSFVSRNELEAVAAMLPD